MSEPVKDDNSPEENEEDPIVMYLVVHELGMSTGKIAAQVGHAVGLLYIEYIHHLKYMLFGKSPEPFIEDKLKLWEEWQSGHFRKVTLTANDSKWAKLKTQLLNSGISYSVVVDAGFTEIPRGSETVIGVYPMRKSNRPPILRKLQALK